MAKRREKADNWVVDESSIGKKMPSAFADQFVQEQTIQQQRVMENKMHEEHQRQQTIQQQSAIELEQRQEQQQFSQQHFAAQQQMKQEQSLELRKQQEIRVSQSEVELPNNLKRTDLKNRGCSTPGIDLGCHNTQGINVWANTAPRGWGTLKRESRQAASSSYESSLQLQMQSDLQRTQNEFEQNEREERMFLEKQQESLRCQREEEESFMIQQQQEQLKIQKEHEEMILYQQQQEKIRVQREEEMLLIQQQQE